MSVMGAIVSALLGLSTYEKPPKGGVTIDSDIVERTRAAYGGQLTPMQVTRTRWYLADLEKAVRSADVGDLSLVAQMYRSMRGDGVLSGLLTSRAGGLVCLPKRFSGDAEITRALQAGTGTRSVFDDMLPPAELALLDADGIMVGVGVGELVEVPGRDYPVLVRLDPECLRYRWSENRWYYHSIVGPLPITPGDGRWVLHTPGGRVAPWQHGQWKGCGRAWIHKEHAMMYRSNWEAKLANPARVATAPIGASEGQRDGWLSQVAAWGLNSVFELLPGYGIELLESNGRGYESFQATISSSDLEFKVALAGQTVTTDGGAGFSNADVPDRVRGDLIQMDAEGLAHTVNTQCLPPYIAKNYGVGRLKTGTVVKWDTTPAKDLKAEAESLNQFGQALKQISEAFQAHGVKVDVPLLANRFGIPIAGDANGDGLPDDDYAAGDDETQASEVLQ